MRKCLEMVNATHIILVSLQSVNSITYMKMPSEEKKDRKKSIVLVWSLNVHSNQTLAILDTIKVRTEIQTLQQSTND